MNLHGIYRCVLAVIVTNLGGCSGTIGGRGGGSSSLNLRALGRGAAHPHLRTHLHIPVFPFKKPQKWADSAIVRCLHAHIHIHTYICMCVYMYVCKRIRRGKVHTFVAESTLESMPNLGLIMFSTLNSH